MRRRQSAVAVAVFALAVAITAAATPVGGVNAASSLELGAQHTTDSDFTAAQTLTNVSVVGSGQSASVTLNSSTATAFVFSDGFDSEPADAGVPEAWSGSWTNVSTTRALNGTQSAGADGTSSNQRISHPLPATTDKINVSIRGEQTGSQGVGIQLNEGGGNKIEVMMFDGDLQYFDGSSFNTISTEPDHGEFVTIEISDIDPAADTFTVTWATEGGEYGRSTGLSMAGDMTSGYDDIELFAEGASGFFDQVEVGDGVGAGPPTGRYLGSNLTADDATELAINRTLQNATMNATLEAYSGGSWGEVATLNDTNSSTTNTTVPISGGGSNDTYRLDLNFSREDGDTAAELHDTTLLFNSTSPALDGGAATPQGGTQLTDTQVSLEVPLNDSDFGTAQGDNITTDIYLDGSRVGQVSRQSNGTVSLTTTISTGGSHTWSAVARSQNYSEPTDSIANKSFAIPDTLSVRNESNASQLITGANIEVTFIGSGGTIVTREDTNQDGNISLTGLPADETFLAEASLPGYHDRRILIDSLIEQQNIYLLNKSVVSAVAIDFTLDDRTGRFQDDDTELIVERPLNRSGNTEWATVVGDQLGAAGQLPTLLERDQRYRLTVRNGEESRVLGTYIASAPKDPEVLPISFVEISADADDSAVFGAALHDLDPGRQVRFVYFDPADATDQLQYEIVYSNDTSNKLVSNTTVTDPNQRFVHTEPVPSAALANVSFEVRVHADRSGGQQDAGFNQTVGDVKDLGGQWGIDGGALELIGWVFIYAGGAMMTLRSPRLAALGIPAVAALFALTGIVSFHPVPVAIAGTMGVLYVVAGGGGP